MESFAFPDEFLMKLAKVWTIFKTDSRAFFVKIEKLLVKNNHFNIKLWATLRSPRNARLNQGTCYSQGKVSSFQGMCLLSYLNGWCGSYLRTTKGCRTRYLKSSGLYIYSSIFRFSCTQNDSSIYSWFLAVLAKAFNLLKTTCYGHT